MVMCWVSNCKHYSERETCRFFKFPKTPSEENRWKALLRRDILPGLHSRVCSCHFVDGKKENGPTIASQVTVQGQQRKDIKCSLSECHNNESLVQLFPKDLIKRKDSMKYNFGSPVKRSKEINKREAVVEPIMLKKASLTDKSKREIMQDIHCSVKEESSELKSLASIKMDPDCIIADSDTESCNSDKYASSENSFHLTWDEDMLEDAGSSRMNNAKQEMNVQEEILVTEEFIDIPHPKAELNRHKKNADQKSHQRTYKECPGQKTDVGSVQLKSCPRNSIPNPEDDHIDYCKSKKSLKCSYCPYRSKNLFTMKNHLYVVHEVNLLEDDSKKEKVEEVSIRHQGVTSSKKGGSISSKGPCKTPRNTPSRQAVCLKRKSVKGTIGKIQKSKKYHTVKKYVKNAFNISNNRHDPKKEKYELSNDISVVRKIKLDDVVTSKGCESLIAPEDITSKNHEALKKKCLPQENNGFYPVKDLIKTLSQSVILQEKIWQTRNENNHYFKCGLCEFSAEKIASLKNHVRLSHFNLASVSCNDCQFFNNYPSLFIETVKSLHICSEIRVNSDFKFIISFENFKPSNINNTGNSIKNKKVGYRCGLCNITSKTVKSLQIHVSRVHLYLVPFKCPKCNFFKYYPQIIAQSIKSLHECYLLNKRKGSFLERIPTKGDNLTSESNSKKEDNTFEVNNTTNDPKNNKIMKFKCQHCDYFGSNNRNLRSHERLKHNKLVSFSCSKCGFIKKYPSIIVKTIKIHHKCIQNRKKKYKCSVCSYSTNQMNILHKHKQTHRFKQSCIQCEYCNFLAVSLTSLKVHIDKTHKEQSTWTCKRCFLVTDLLEKKNHICVSTPVKNNSSFMNEKTTANEANPCDQKNSESKDTSKFPESCDQFNSTPVARTSTKKKRRQLEPKRFTKCPFCDYSSFGITSLRKHINYHHAELKVNSEVTDCRACDLIAKGTAESNYFKRQGHQNSRNLKWPCVYCDFVCFCKILLSQHDRSKHKGLMLKTLQRKMKMITNVEETGTSRLGLLLKNLHGKNKTITHVEETESLILKNQQIGKKNLQENNEKIITSDEETESASESEHDSPLVDEIVPNKKIVQPEDYSYYCKESSDVQERDPLGSSESPENKAKIEKIKKHLVRQVQTRVQWRRMSTDEWENTTFGPTKDSCDLIDVETLAYEDYPCEITSPESPVKYYPCKFCTYLFTNRVELNSHVSIFHKPFITDVNLKINDFACSECEYAAKDQRELSRHKNRYHKKVYYYFCPFCMFRSSNNSGVSSHIILDHSCGSNVWCTFCDHNYCIGMRNHNHRKSYKKSLFESDYCCEGCNFTCLREETFLLHVFDTHCFD